MAEQNNESKNITMTPEELQATIAAATAMAAGAKEPGLWDKTKGFYENHSEAIWIGAAALATGLAIGYFVWGGDDAPSAE